MKLRLLAGFSAFALIVGLVAVPSASAEDGDGGSAGVHAAPTSTEANGISGTIFGKDGDPLSAACARLSPASDPDGYDSVCAGAEGTYAFGDLKPGNYSLQFVGPGGNGDVYASQDYVVRTDPALWKGLLRVGEDSGWSNVDAQLELGGGIRATVTVPADAEDVQSVCVDAQDPYSGESIASDCVHEPDSDAGNGWTVSLSGLPAGDYTVDARVDTSTAYSAYEGEAQATVTGDGGWGEVSIDVVAASPGGGPGGGPGAPADGTIPVDGNVYDESGAAAVGATLTFTCYGADYSSVTAVTDDIGHYSADIPKCADYGWVQVSAQPAADDDAFSVGVSVDFNTEAPIGDSGSTDIQLPLGGAVTGTVTYGNVGESNIAVVLSKPVDGHPEWDAYNELTFTDGDGAFRFDHVPADTGYIVDAAPDSDLGIAPKRYSGVVVSVGEVTEIPEEGLALDQAIYLGGTVTDGDTDEPLRGVCPIALPADENLPRFQSFTVSCSVDDGTYLGQSLTTGQYDIQSLTAGWYFAPSSSITVTGEPGSTFTHDVQMTLGGKVAGTLLDDGDKPIRGAGVSVLSGGDQLVSRTDSNGEFLLGPVPAGTVTVTISKDGFADQVVDATIVGGMITIISPEPLGPAERQAPTVTQNPASQTVAAGSDVTLTAAATGYPTPTVRWQRESVGGSWADLEGATSTTLDLAEVPVTENGVQYRAMFHNEQGDATTTVATLSVYDLVAPAAPTATLDGPTANSAMVRWTAPGAAAIGAATIDKYRVTPYLGDAAQDSVEVTSGTTYSATGLTLGAEYSFTVAAHYSGLDWGPESAKSDTVQPIGDGPQIATGPADAAVQVGDDATFTAGATSPSDVTVQWQRKDGTGGWEPVDGATTDTLTVESVTLADDGAQFRAGFTNTGGGPIWTQPATLRVYALVAPGTPTAELDDAAPDQATVSWTAPGAASFGAATIDGYRVSSYVNEQPQAVLEVSDGTSVRFTGLSVGQNYTFQVAAHYAVDGVDSLVTWGDWSATSNVVVPHHDSPTVITSPQDASVAAGTSATFTAAGTGYPVPTVQWQRKDGTGEWADVTGATSPTLTVSSVSVVDNGAKFRAVFTNAEDKATTEAATLSVYALLAPGTPTAELDATQTTTATVTWDAPNTDLLGSATVASYRVTPYADGVAQTAVTVTGDTSHEFTGLTVGKRYRFTVEASYGAELGYGLPSTQSNGVVPTAMLPTDDDGQVSDETTDPEVPLTVQGADGSSAANTQATASGGTGKLVITAFTDNPAAAPEGASASTPSTFNAGAATYLDLYIAPVGADAAPTFTTVTFEVCDLPSGAALFWWNPVAGDGGQWQPVNPVTASADAANPGRVCITAALSSTSSPTLSELTGTMFAAAPEVKYVKPSDTSTGGGGGGGSSEAGASATSAARISGASRYATAGAVAVEFATGSDGTVTPVPAVVVANGSTAKAGFDALAANYLAGQLGAPILLTEATTLPTATAQALATIAGPSTVIYVMGGTDSVSADVADRLAAIRGAGGPALTVVRVAGKNRYATSADAAVAKGTPAAFGLGTGRSLKTAILASGENNADALAAGSLSFGAGIPVLLTGRDALPDEVAAAIRALGIGQVIVLGGVDRISQGVVDALAALGVTSTKRIAGSSRFATSAELYAFARAASSAGGLGWADGTGVFLANGYGGFPDALAVGPLAGRSGAALVTVSDMATLPAAVAAFLKGAGLGSARAVGGTDRVSASVLAQAQGYVG